jgi:hypothetical protein
MAAPAAANASPIRDPNSLFQPTEFDAIVASNVPLPKVPPQPGVPKWNIRTESDIHVETLGNNQHCTSSVKYRLSSR